LTSFFPGLSSDASDELCDEARTSPFSFLDFWTIDFDWREGEPFHIDWSAERPRKGWPDRIESDNAGLAPLSGGGAIAVKAVDVFGNEAVCLV
jgi:hypothetical protein